MRILLTRTDRIGDVVLSTPAIKAVRERYPDAYIAFMVRPYAENIVVGNPYLNEVIVYDKYGKEKNFLNTILFALKLRKKKFDIAIMLHPTARVHLMSFIAGIPERIGYDRKMPFFLTKRVRHTKEEGLMHELEYTLDLLKTINVETRDKTLFVPVNKECEKNIERILDEHHIGKDIPLVAVNPGASCPSKRWSAENFASLGDKLPNEIFSSSGRGKARIVIVGDKKNAEFASRMAGDMRYEPVNLAGRTTVGELAALLGKCKLFVSNDSGPVHIACALGTPVISIFGRCDPGLSPRRWGPTGKKNIIFHKNVGCDPCLAHNCKIGFKCLKAVTPDEVIKAATRLLST